MNNKQIRWLSAGIIAVAMCFVAIEWNLPAIVWYKATDLMTDTVTIKYNPEKYAQGRAAVSPDGSKLAFCKNTEEFFVRDIKTGNVTAYPSQEKVFQIKYSPDGQYVAAGRNILKVSTGKVTVLPTSAHPGLAFDRIAFSTDSAMVAIVNEDKALHPRPNIIEIWNVRTKQLIQQFTKERFLIHQMAFSPDGHYLAVAGDGISLWDIQSGKCVKTLDSGFKAVDNIVHSISEYDAIAYSPDGKNIATALRNIYYDGSNRKGKQTELIEIWDVEQEKVVKTMTWDTHEVMRFVKYSPDGQYIASGRTIGNLFDLVGDAVWIWDVKQGKVVKKLTNFYYGTLEQMDYSADGNSLSASTSYATKIWKLQ